MKMWGIRVGMMGMRRIRVRMWEIRMGIQGIGVGMQVIRGGNEGNNAENLCVGV